MIKVDFTRRRYTGATVRDGKIYLDARELLTPAQQPLHLPAALAEAIAAEWQAQESRIDPARMPLTQLAFTAIDRIAPHTAAVIDDLLAYLETELICHYGDDAALIAFQKQRWQPLHDWLQRRFDVSLPVTTAIRPLRAVADTTWAESYLRRLTALQLVALQQAVSITGSLIVGLALVEREIDAATALAAAEAESDFQAQKWGMDADIAARRAGQLQELETIRLFLEHIRPVPL